MHRNIAVLLQRLIRISEPVEVFTWVLSGCIQCRLTLDYKRRLVHRLGIGLDELRLQRLYKLLALHDGLADEVRTLQDGRAWDVGHLNWLDSMRDNWRAHVAAQMLMRNHRAALPAHLALSSIFNRSGNEA